MEKAVILARGLGTRMRKDDDQAALSDQQAQIAKIGLKAMISIDRPFLDYVLHALAEAGYKQICLIIGPEHDMVRDYYSKIETKRVSIDFAVQEKPLGTADAVKAARDFTGSDDFLVINSDNYYPIEALTQLRLLSGPGLAGFDRDALVEKSNIEPERIEKFAVTKIDPEGNLIKILEKPSPADIESVGTPVCMSMNCWRFSPKIYTACDTIEPSKRGEYEITDAVQYTIDSLGEKYKVVPIKGAVLDMSSRKDIKPVADKLQGTPVEL